MRRLTVCILSVALSPAAAQWRPLTATDLATAPVADHGLAPGDWLHPVAGGHVVVVATPRSATLRPGVVVLLPTGGTVAMLRPALIDWHPAGGLDAGGRLAFDSRTAGWRCRTEYLVAGGQLRLLTTYGNEQGAGTLEVPFLDQWLAAEDADLDADDRVVAPEDGSFRIAYDVRIDLDRTDDGRWSAMAISGDPQRSLVSRIGARIVRLGRRPPQRTYRPVAARDDWGGDADDTGRWLRLPPGQTRTVTRVVTLAAKPAAAPAGGLTPSPDLVPVPTPVDASSAPMGSGTIVGSRRGQPPAVPAPPQEPPAALDLPLPLPATGAGELPPPEPVGGIELPPLTEPMRLIPNLPAPRDG